MAKVPAYHTDSEEYSHRDVYHNHDDCPDGKQIQAKHWKSGDGNRPRCKKCIDLG